MLQAEGFEIVGEAPDGASALAAARALRPEVVLLDGAGSFSPDGTKIVYINNSTGAFQVYVMNLDGTGVTRLTNAKDAHWATGERCLRARTSGSAGASAP